MRTSMLTIGVALIGAMAPNTSLAQPTSRAGVLEVSLLAGGHSWSGQSEFFTLVNRELQPGASGLGLRTFGADAAWHVRDRLAVTARLVSGRRSLASTARLNRSAQNAPVAQTTTLELQAPIELGVRFDAWRLRSIAGHRIPLTTLELSGGVGVSRYELQQNGEFVDAERQVVFADHFRSRGTGVTSSFGAGVSSMVTSRIGLRFEARQLWGKADMSDDFADFRPLDLGARVVTGGLVVRLR